MQAEPLSKMAVGGKTGWKRDTTNTIRDNQIKSRGDLQLVCGPDIEVLRHQVNGCEGSLLSNLEAAISHEVDSWHVVRSCVPRPPTRRSATRRPDLQLVTVEVRTSPVRIFRATRLVAQNASARSLGSSTSMCSTLRTLVRPTARSVPLGKRLSRWDARPEHVLIQTALAPSFSQRVPAEHVSSQTALAPTLSQWVPAFVLIHPHVTLGRVHSTRSAKPPTVPLGQRRRTVSACSQSLTCAITLKPRSGLKDTRAYASPASLPKELE